MIAVDTSAPVAILLNESARPACMDAIEAADICFISAGTLAEVLIVAAGRGVPDRVAMLIDNTEVEVVPVTAVSAHAVAAAYRRWGKGFHPAALNYGDCFAYQLARERDCPLLYVGDDFARTDVRSAL